MNYRNRNFLGKTERFRDTISSSAYTRVIQIRILKHSCFYMYKEISLIKRLTITSFLSWKVVIVPWQEPILTMGRVYHF